jgi:hypothetical protein
MLGIIIKVIDLTLVIAHMTQVDSQYLLINLALVPLIRVVITLLILAEAVSNE